MVFCILICCPSVSNSPQPLLLQFRSTPLEYKYTGQGGYSGAPARPRHRRPRISMTSEIMGSKSKYFCPFMAGLTGCHCLLRSGDGKRRAAKLAKDMQFTTSTCQGGSTMVFQSDYTLVSLPFHVLSKGKALILICHRIYTPEN